MVFEITTNGGGFATLYSFHPSTGVNPQDNETNADGLNPTVGVTLTGNVAYGTTSGCGTNGDGVIYRLAISPVLDIARTGTNVLVTWPTLNTGYTLQSATNMTSSAWTTVSPSPVDVGGQYIVTNSIGGKAKYYRLFK